MWQFMQQDLVLNTISKIPRLLVILLVLEDLQTFMQRRSNFTTESHDSKSSTSSSINQMPYIFQGGNAYITICA